MLSFLMYSLEMVSNWIAIVMLAHFHEVLRTYLIWNIFKCCRKSIKLSKHLVKYQNCVSMNYMTLYTIGYFSIFHFWVARCTMLVVFMLQFLSICALSSDWMKRIFLSCKTNCQKWIQCTFSNDLIST